MSHNAAKNKTATAEDGPNAASNLDMIVSEPVSSAYLLVTEAMILAGEAIGRFQAVTGIAEETRKKEGNGKFENCLRLPFRSQRKPGKLKVAIYICESMHPVKLMVQFANPKH